MESKAALNNALITYITPTRPCDGFCSHSNHCHMLLKFALSTFLFYFLSYSWIVTPSLLTSPSLLYCFTPIPTCITLSAALGGDTIQA